MVENGGKSIDDKVEKGGNWVTLAQPTPILEVRANNPIDRDNGMATTNQLHKTLYMSPLKTLREKNITKLRPN